MAESFAAKKKRAVRPPLYARFFSQVVFRQTTVFAIAALSARKSSKPLAGIADFNSSLKARNFDLGELQLAGIAWKPSAAPTAGNPQPMKSASSVFEKGRMRAAGAHQNVVQ